MDTVRAAPDLQPILGRAVAEGRALGLVAGVIVRGGEPAYFSVGRRGPEGEGAMTADTLFWIASCTKAVTSVAALQLVERGLVSLDEPVSRWLPALARPRVLQGFDDQGRPVTAPAARPITLRHLLTHTSGLSYDFSSDALTRYLQVTGTALNGPAEPRIPLLCQPGERWVYGIGIDWAAHLIARVSGQPFDAYLADHVLRPLGMTDTTFFPTAEQARRRASLAQKQGPGLFTPSSLPLPRSRHFMLGGGGLYSTAPDYLKFLRAILNRGAPLLAPATFDLMMRDQLGGAPAGAIVSANPLISHDCDLLPGVAKTWGLAGMINLAPGPAGRSTGSLAWAGLPNCYYWADPAAATAGVLMAQHLPFGDPQVIETFAEIEHAAYGSRPADRVDLDCGIYPTLTT